MASNVLLKTESEDYYEGPSERSIRVVFTLNYQAGDLEGTWDSLRATVKRDFYEDQSSGYIEIFDRADLGWKIVHYSSPGFLRCAQIPFYNGTLRKALDHDVMQLLDTALKILGHEEVNV